MTSDAWQPVVRIGEPKFIAGVGNRIKVEVKTKGWLSRDWRRYFRSQVAQQQLDARYPADPCWDEVQRIEGSCPHDDAECYIEMIDAAIHYANTKFQSETLPAGIVRDAQNRPPRTVRERQATLDQLARKLAKPEPGGHSLSRSVPALIDDVSDMSRPSREGGSLSPEDPGRSIGANSPWTCMSTRAANESRTQSSLPKPLRLIGPIRLATRG